MPSISMTSSVYFCTLYTKFGLPPLPGCQSPPGLWTIFRFGNPNLNLHLPQESWEGGQPKLYYNWLYYWFYFWCRQWLDKQLPVMTASICSEITLTTLGFQRWKRWKFVGEKIELRGFIPQEFLGLFSHAGDPGRWHRELKRALFCS